MRDDTIYNPLSRVSHNPFFAYFSLQVSFESRGIALRLSEFLFIASDGCGDAEFLLVTARTKCESNPLCRLH